MRLHINPRLLNDLKLCPLFVQYGKGTGRLAGYLFGFEIINDKTVESYKWVK